MTRSSKQERAYQKRQHEKWQERQQAKSARRRRTTMVLAAVLGLAVLVGVILVVVLNRPDAQEPAPGNDPTVTQDTPVESAPLQTTDPELYDEAPDPAEAEGRTWELTLSTSQGDIGLELDGENAPQATAGFLHLAREGFYDGTSCHRLLPASLLQCGDPTATGTGGPGYSYGPIENAPADDVYPAGTLAMARQGNNGESMGSQFFMVFADVTLPADSAGGYTVFGRITEGLEILQQVGSAGTVPGSEQPALPVTIEGVTIS